MSVLLVFMHGWCLCVVSVCVVASVLLVTMCFCMLLVCVWLVGPGIRCWCVADVCVLLAWCVAG